MRNRARYLSKMCIKNMYASEYIWNSIKYDKTVGVVLKIKNKGLVSIAELIRCYLWGNSSLTNPTSTIFQALIALKTRNSIVFAFTHQLQNHQRSCAHCS